MRFTPHDGRSFDRVRRAWVVRLAACCLGFSCSRPSRAPPERVLQMQVARESGVAESEVNAECFSTHQIFHGGEIFDCRAEADGATGLYTCDCPQVATRTWPRHDPWVSPWRAPRPCECSQICCLERAPSACDDSFPDGHDGYTCFDCEKSNGCVIDAACSGVWPTQRCWQQKDPRTK